MPVTAPGPITLRNIRFCARCGGDHKELAAAPLTQPFEPPEAGGVIWSHWVACPTNGEPILVRRDVEPIAELGDRL